MTDRPKSFHVSAEVHAYLVQHGTPPDEIQRALIEETQKLGGISIMQIAPEQGAFMTLLARAIGTRYALEVGTFTGYSALCIARALPDAGRLICCDVSEEWTTIARRYWEKAGVSEKIDLRIAPALDTLRALPEQPQLDFAFIDADKPGYIAYYEEILKRLRPGGLILVDNVLWLGRVVDASANDEQTLAIRDFNNHVARDSRVECVMLPVSDGLTLLRKR
ncbi:MAG: O-methyltransferase [Deltaproteobacteria bacterium]|nr:O-methyltransferase [Deltaproteobacteria bacterium]MCZ6712503.1 O-methyltransferase [Deltaproteobacteria bacterium]